MGWCVGDVQMVLFLASWFCGLSGGVLVVYVWVFALSSSSLVLTYSFSSLLPLTRAQELGQDASASGRFDMRVLRSGIWHSTHACDDSRCGASITSISACRNRLWYNICHKYFGFDFGLKR